jgi:hypothetical protein
MSNEDARGVSGTPAEAAQVSADEEFEWNEFVEAHIERLRIWEEELEQELRELEARRFWLDKLLDRIGFGVAWPGIAGLDRPLQLRSEDFARMRSR